ncbi:MAG: DUF2953 domain-containing protein [Oscillospiraceae bacterium]|nr:DUF2953 domain-containing protein [Oscillospiraceae bacterium]
MILALKIIGYVLLAILALVLLILVVPLTFNVEYFQKVLRIRFRLIFPITIYPRRKKDGEEGGKASKKKTGKEKKERSKSETSGHKVGKPAEAKPEHPEGPVKTETAENGEKTEEKKSGPKFTLDMVSELLPEVSETLKKLLRFIRIRKVVIILPIYHPDPAKNGEMVGYTWAGLGNLIPLTKHIFNIEYNRVDVIPDFENVHNGEIMLAADITSSVILLIICVINLLFAYLRLKKKSKV